MKELLLNYTYPKKYFRISKIFVISSLWCGLTNVSLEVLRCKIQIISSKYISSLKEIFKKLRRLINFF